MKDSVKYIDLFAGLGGFRVGFEKACEIENIDCECVFTSEIKEPAVESYLHNFDEEDISGNIREIEAEEIPDFDLLFAGFPCQAFSSAGNRDGFMDTRGTLFFEIERILEERRPYGFILENVPGLVTHDREDKDNEIGRTMRTILGKLRDMGYEVSWELHSGTDFGLPQDRERVFIVGTKDQKIDISDLGNPEEEPKFKQVKEEGKETLNTELAESLTNHFSLEELHGKAIKDTRGGDNNIHSWELELRGETNEFQRKVLNELLKQRRRKKWARKKDITWMDGMPLTADEIRSFMRDENLEAFTGNSEFYDKLDNLEEELQDLVEKGYLAYEHPKELVEVEAKTTDGTKKVRKEDESKEKGYNIVTGKLSFGINKILDPEGQTPTLVATDVDRLAVPNGDGLRRLTKREGLRLFGYPEWYEVPVDWDDAFDLLGNTVPVPIVTSIGRKMIEESNIQKSSKSVSESKASPEASS